MDYIFYTAKKHSRSCTACFLLFVRVCLSTPLLPLLLLDHMYSIVLALQVFEAYCLVVLRIAGPVRRAVPAGQLAAAGETFWTAVVSPAAAGRRQLKEVLAAAGLMPQGRGLTQLTDGHLLLFDVVVPGAQPQILRVLLSDSSTSSVDCRIATEVTHVADHSCLVYFASSLSSSFAMLFACIVVDSVLYLCCSSDSLIVALPCCCRRFPAGLGNVRQPLTRRLRSSRAGAIALRLGSAAGFSSAAEPYRRCRVQPCQLCSSDTAALTSWPAAAAASSVIRRT
jgi:hypothetical protein